MVNHNFEFLKMAHHSPSGSEDSLIRQARVIRLEAERLSFQRTLTVDALQEALEETKRGSKDSINKLERKNRELQQTLQRLKEESDASTRREQVSLLFSCPIKWRVVNLLEN